MDKLTIIAGGTLLLMLTAFLLRLSYLIFNNLINGRKFHESLDDAFSRLRLSKMLRALGINQTAYIYQTNVNDIRRHMANCSACTNTSECDEKLAQANGDGSEIDSSTISFCHNETELVALKEQQAQIKDES